ncbi:hypothetical protein J7355_13110 [Endozoicomonas sp. G2_2]|uniref:hypothetical protein n=1 Tax=Endozoicomonas sp. G2_2 TaxID=2821092 RepID=UPI001ADB178B|nr:hypothetical protein [Endozoicomonas sp. G2_2]MBO9471033.1 hypothetical protein [Endozoicomonas sp. G2_2]
MSVMSPAYSLGSINSTVTPRRSKAAIAPEMLSSVDFGIRLITAGFVSEDRARIASLTATTLEQAIDAGLFTRAEWDAGALCQRAVDILVYALDQHRLDGPAINALLEGREGAGAALYYYLAHAVLVASAIAATRGARQRACRQLWCRHLYVDEAQVGGGISAGAPAWVLSVS